ncbi:MAG: hypothetical protein HZB55_17725 [Deltaproteobacteria bacterium]|nr:hypothetical protein [Deltaproteobacteria bacterium]
MRHALRSLLGLWAVVAFAAAGCAPLRHVPPAVSPAPAPPPEAKPPRTPAVTPAPATPEPEEEPTPPPRHRLPPRKAREQLAADLTARGDLAGALIQWKILALLEPDNPEYDEGVDATRRKIDAGVKEHLILGDAARRRGDTAMASEEYLKVLALDPLDQTAPPLLREMERITVRDQELAKVRRESRKSGPMTVPRAAPPQAPAPTSEAAYYLDTGVELFQQGEYEASVVELEKYLRSFPDDAKAHKVLSDAHIQLGSAALKAGDAAGALRHYEEASRNGGKDNPQVAAYVQQARKKIAADLYEKGVRASRNDLKKAMDYWKQCLSYDPTHVAAKSQLDKATKMQERLQQIQ